MFMSEERGRVRGEPRLRQQRLRAVARRYGRFLQPDPIGYEAGTNLYAYVGNDPVNFVDPWGLEEKCVSSKVGGGAEDLGGGDIGITASRMEYACYQTNPNGGELRAYSDGAGGGGGIGLGPVTVCPPVPFKITGVGPDQANTSQKTAISQQSGTKIDASGGGVAIKPGNFGVANARGARREVFAGLTLIPLWGTGEDPAGPTPAIPKGLPSSGPYHPIDVISPPSVRNSAGNHIDLYRYSSQRNALASTRRVLVITVVPANDQGVSCPVAQ